MTRPKKKSQTASRKVRPRPNQQKGRNEMNLEQLKQQAAAQSAASLDQAFALGQADSGTPDPPATELEILKLDGEFWRPRQGSPDTEWGRFDLLDLPDEFRSISVDLTIDAGPWHPGQEDGVHGLLWLHRGKWRNDWKDNVVGYLNARGPSRNIIRNGTNAGTGQGDLAQQGGPYTITAGDTLQASYVYGQGQWTASVNGRQLNGTANAQPLQGGLWGISFGHPDGKLPEAPTWGWGYRDLRVAVTV